MSSYWLDTNVFITAKNGPYAFDIAPGFWDFLERRARDGSVRSSSLVYRELVDRTDDDLAIWARQHRNSGLFVEPDELVQGALAEIARYVIGHYPTHEARFFLSAADPWVIAHAKVDAGTVVTFERMVGRDSKRVKIPNVCAQFEVKYTNLWEMLRALNASFH